MCNVYIEIHLVGGFSNSATVRPLVVIAEVDSLHVKHSKSQNKIIVYYKELF
jgi:hypothetical protein